MWLFVFVEVETRDQHPKASAIVKQTFTEPGNACRIYGLNCEGLGGLASIGSYRLFGELKGKT